MTASAGTDTGPVQPAITVHGLIVREYHFSGGIRAHSREYTRGSPDMESAGMTIAIILNRCATTGLTGGIPACRRAINITYADLSCRPNSTETDSLKG
jgi:hypothetical protein